MQKIRQSVKERFTGKEKEEDSQKTDQSATEKPKDQELYTDNEDLGFC